MLAVIDEVTVKSLSSLFSGHELNIVAYIRRPDEVIKSSHNQIVKDSKWPRDLNERPFPYDPSFFSILNSWLRNFFTEIILVDIFLLIFGKASKASLIFLHKYTGSIAISWV